MAIEDRQTYAALHRVANYRQSEADNCVINWDSKNLLVEVIESYTPLKKCGREFLGHCPLHDDRHPSLRVNPEKGVWFCPPCGTGGDVIRLIEKVEGLGFKEALAYLDIKEPNQRPRKSQAEKDEAKKIRTWALNLGELVGERLREIGQTQRLLGELPDKELAESEIKYLQREWHILAAVDDDLVDPETLLELWREKELIVNFVGGLE